MLHKVEILKICPRIHLSVCIKESFAYSGQMNIEECLTPDSVVGMGRVDLCTEPEHILILSTSVTAGLVPLNDE